MRIAPILLKKGQCVVQHFTFLSLRPLATMVKRFYIVAMLTVHTFSSFHKRHLLKAKGYVMTFCALLSLGIIHLGFTPALHAKTLMDAPELSELSSASSAEQQRAAAFGVWQNQESVLPRKEDKIWQQGTSAGELLRQKNPLQAKPTPNPTPDMGPQQAPAPTEPAKEGITLAGGAIKGDSDVIGSTWHAPGSQEPIIDEDMMHRQHDVVGAYGQMASGDDFKMTMGPELYIPGEGADVLGKDSSEASELGMSMKFKWGF